MRLESLLRFRRKETASDAKPSVVFIGNFRFKDQIDSTISHLNTIGVDVLAPRQGVVIGEREWVKILDSDGNSSGLDVEAKFIDALKKADAAYMVNPNGYIGNMFVYEIGFAAAIGMPIYSQEKIKIGPEDEDQDLFTSFINAIKAVSLEEFVSMAAAKNWDTKGQWWYRAKNKRPKTILSEDIAKLGITIDILNRIAHGEENILPSN